MTDIQSTMQQHVPGVTASDDDPDFFERLLAFFRPTEENRQRERELGVRGGSGILEMIDGPAGAAAGVAKASLPLFGRRATSAVSNIAEESSFVQKLLGSFGADDISRTLDKNRTVDAIERGAEEAEMLDMLLKGPFNMNRSAAQGTREMFQDDKGRTVIDLYQRLGMNPQTTTKLVDKAAIETLLSQVGGR